MNATDMCESDMNKKVSEIVNSLKYLTSAQQVTILERCKLIIYCSTVVTAIKEKPEIIKGNKKEE